MNIIKMMQARGCETIRNPSFAVFKFHLQVRKLKIVVVSMIY
jgi:hypothetical protein